MLVPVATMRLLQLVLEKECRLRKWLPPRLPRGTAAEKKYFPWRSLYRYVDVTWKFFFVSYTLEERQTDPGD